MHKESRLQSFLNNPARAMWSMALPIIAGMMVFGIYSHFHLTGETNLFPGLIYCLFLLFAIFILVKHKHFIAGIFCVSPPLVIFGMILWFGFHPNNGSFEKIILSVFLAFWFFLLDFQ